MRNVFSTYLGTSLALGPANNAVLNDFIGETQQEVSILEKRLQDLQSDISQKCHEVGRLRSDIGRKQEHIRTARSLQTPIRTLPPEVLDIIFEMCLPEYDGAITPTSPPLVLSAVCRSWRNVAINNPFLWQDVCLDVSRNLELEEVKKFENFVDMVLARARKTSLDLKIEDSEPSLALRKEHFGRRFIVKCAELFPTCRNLDLSISSYVWSFCYAISDPAICLFERLTDLNLNLDCWDDRQELSIFQNAPNLDTFNCTLRASTLPSIVLPYSQLAFMNCTVKFSSQRRVLSELRKWRKFLSLCENLELSEIRFESEEAFSVELEQSLNPVVLNNLTSFHIDAFELYGDVGSVLHGIATPSLDHFAFMITSAICQLLNGPAAERISPVYLEFTQLAPNFASVCYLSLRLVAIADSDVRPFLELLPRVEYLHIVNFKIDPPLYTDDFIVPENTALVHHLTESAMIAGGRRLLPRLAHLMLSYPYHESKHPGVVQDYIQLLQARCEMNAASGLCYSSSYDFRFELEFCVEFIPRSVISSVIADITSVSSEQHRFSFTHRLVDGGYIYAAA